jgi:hypothetical protein
VASQRQIEANRRNAQKSTGPRSLQGKAVSRFNALQTGINADSAVIPGESSFRLQCLTREYYHRWQPTLPEERALVDSIVHDEWQLRRLRIAEAQLWAHVELDRCIWDGRKTPAPMGATAERGATAFSRLHWRYEVTDRRFRRNLELLQAMSQSAAELAEAISKDAALASAQPQPIDTSALWPVPEREPKPETEPAPPLFEAPPEPVELASSPLPEPEAISITPTPSTPPHRIGFVPKPTPARGPAHAEPLVNTSWPLPAPEGGQPESPVTAWQAVRVVPEAQ